MKQSPLQLRWVHYPSASYEACEEFTAETGSSPASVSAQVRFFADGEHMGYLKLESINEDPKRTPYKFSVSVLACFVVDAKAAREVYAASHSVDLWPRFVAVNVARILYGGAREQIAMMTARSVHGAAMLESSLLEPKDVEISSDVSPREIMKGVFAASDDELVKLEEKIQATKKEAMALRGDEPASRDESASKSRKAKPAKSNKSRDPA